MNHPNLILLHGALGSEAQFNHLKKLLENHFNLYTFNFDGHGGKIPDKPFSIDLFVKNIVEMMDKKSIQEAHLFGYSMGGYVALKLAQNYPKRVGKIFTLATKFNWSPETANKETKLLNPSKIEEKIPHFAKVLQERHAPANWKTVVEKTAELMQNLGNKPALTHRDLKFIQNNALVAVGDQDQMVSKEETEIAAQTLVNGKFKLIENCQHPIEKVNAEVLTNLMKEFLN